MSQKYLLLVGGSGALGRSIVNVFKDKWKIVNIDLVGNEQSDVNILLNQKESPSIYLDQINQKLQETSSKYDSIMCVAGGWVGGSIKDPEIFDQVEQMYQTNIKTALLTSHLASQYLNNKRLLIFTGAAVPFQNPTPGMLAYGLSKTATHAIGMDAAQLQSLPEDSTVCTILPEVIDTPNNRKNMPNCDFSKWTSPDQIAEMLFQWSNDNNRPKNGSYTILKTENDKIVPQFV